MLKLKAKNRNIFGKQLKYFRKEGKIPAVVYGKGKKNKHISILLNDFLKIFKEAGESEVIELDMEDGKEHVLIYNVQNDPVKNTPIHADFFIVDINKPIFAFIPLKFNGTSEAVKSLGGVLVKVIHELEAEALPKNMPRELNVDISKLKTFEDKIFVSDIMPPEGVKIKAKPEEVVALAEKPQDEIKEEATTEIDFEKIAVEEKGKKKEESEDGKGDQKERVEKAPD
jgi:large subunit ribosomal protein L25